MRQAAPDAVGTSAGENATVRGSVSRSHEDLMCLRNTSTHGVKKTPGHQIQLSEHDGKLTRVLSIRLM